MPTFRYSGDDRYYTQLGIEARDGDVHELDANPDDGRWTATSGGDTPPPKPPVTTPPVVVETKD